MDDISASLEDYLEMIFILHRKGGEVRVTDIASSLKVSKPSVNRAVGALKEAGLLEHEFYGTIAPHTGGRNAGRAGAAQAQNDPPFPPSHARRAGGNCGGGCLPDGARCERADNPASI